MPTKKAAPVKPAPAKKSAKKTVKKATPPGPAPEKPAEKPKRTRKKKPVENPDLEAAFSGIHLTEAKREPLPLNINEWLRQSPEESEITEIDGIKCLLNLVVEDKLDKLTQQNWSTRNYQSKVITRGRKEYFSASLELVVRYRRQDVAGLWMWEEKFIERVLVGAVSFPINHFAHNVHLDNTAKTLCITNAASELGEQFGRGLNPSVQPVVINAGEVPEPSEDFIDFRGRKPVKPKADIDIIRQRQEAIINDDHEKVKHLDSIYDFSTTTV